MVAYRGNTFYHRCGQDKELKEISRNGDISMICLLDIDHRHGAQRLSLKNKIKVFGPQVLNEIIGGMQQQSIMRDMDMCVESLHTNYPTIQSAHTNYTKGPPRWISGDRTLCHPGHSLQR